LLRFSFCALLPKIIFYGIFPVVSFQSIKTNAPLEIPARAWKPISLLIVVIMVKIYLGAERICDWRTQRKAAAIQATIIDL